MMRTALLPLPLRDWAAERTNGGERGPAPSCPDAPPTPPDHANGPLRNHNPRGNPNLAPGAACPRAWPVRREKPSKQPLPRPRTSR
jgi:hypothetical protein